ncbi:MAG: hypothetical protein KDB23_15440 [Planctomycetales bacterium]|nr:hypothetical protein [Planctomycetales bacterium]
MDTTIEISLGAGPAASWWRNQLGLKSATLDDDTVWVTAVRNGVTRAVAGAQPRAGEHWHVLPVAQASPPDAELAIAVLRQLDEHITSHHQRGVARLLLPVEAGAPLTGPLRQGLGDLGFDLATRVAFVSPPIPTPTARRDDDTDGQPSAESGVRLRPVGDLQDHATRSEFETLFTATLVDCQGALGSGEQSAAQTLADYSADSRNDTSHWYWVEVGVQRAGCVLLAPGDGCDGALSLLYFGVNEGCRGRTAGVGVLGAVSSLRVVRRAGVFSAVDLANLPAWRSYVAAGWHEIFRRDLWWKRW